MLRTVLDFNETLTGNPSIRSLAGTCCRTESTDSSFPIPVGEGRGEDQFPIRGEWRELEQFGDAVFFGLPYSRFEKSVLLPPGLQMDNMKARFHHGVLDINIPYLKQARAREIPVLVGDEVAAMAAAV